MYHLDPRKNEGKIYHRFAFARLKKKFDEMRICIHMNIFELHNMTTFTIPLKYFIFFSYLEDDRVRGMTC